MNTVSLVGRLTKDVELTKGGKGESKWSVTRVTLAVRDGKDKDGEERTQFISVTAWNASAEILEKYAHKGDRVGVVGRLCNNDYTDDDGVKHYTLDVVASNVELLESKREDKREEKSDKAKAKAKSRKASRYDEDEDEDNI